MRSDEQLRETGRRQESLPHGCAALEGPLISSGADLAGRHQWVYLVQVGHEHGLEMSTICFGQYDAESNRTNHRHSTASAEKMTADLMQGCISGTSQALSRLRAASNDDSSRP